MSNDIKQCHQCGLSKEMMSANFYFEAGNKHYYICDDCLVQNAVKIILKALGTCPHLVDIDKIEKILKVLVG